jgi:hypothetical protein
MTFFISVLCGGTLEYLQKFLQCIKYIIFEFAPYAALFQNPHPPPRYPRRVSTGIIFAFTYMCIHYLHPPSSALFFANFLKEKA